MSASVVEVPLTQGCVAMIDVVDSDRVMARKWHAVRAGILWYAESGPCGALPRMFLHRLIMDAPKGTLVDHIDGNGLNNQRTNLRFATHQQNIVNQRLSRANTSGYRGVSLFKNRTHRVWGAPVRYGGKLIHLGFFEDPITAAHVYDEKARVVFGEFARLNFPD